MRRFFKSKFFKVMVVAFVAIVVALFLIERNAFSHGGGSAGSAIQKRLVGDTLNLTIFLDKNLNPAKPGLRFVTTLVRRFSEQHHCAVNISVEKNSEREWDDLLLGETDILIYSLGDSIPSHYEDYTENSLAMEDNYVCVVKLGNDLLLDNINYWIAHFKQTGEYKRLWNNTRRSIANSRYGFGVTRHTISQYDDIVRKYSSSIGWDWRLLSALIYQESKFNQGVISRRGAIGLMQVMEETANKRGIYDVYSPESNIQAGVLELSSLQKRYKKMGADSTNTILLTLAAYNCGRGKMDHLMKSAESKGQEKLIWENLAPFASKETVAHVEKILRQYDLYSQSVVK